MIKTCVVIAGPTAVGKTSLAIELARHFQTDIISADSRQCFRELNIGVAKPTPAQLAAVKHYFINSHSVHNEVNAAIFEKYALEAANEIFREKDIAIMVGGTGLYIKAFCEGMDEMPVIDAGIRANILANYEKHGLGWLQQQLLLHEPVYFKEEELLNPQRLMRALEVQLSTGRSIRSFQTRQKKQRPFHIVKIGLQLPRADLYNQVNTRVDEMMQQRLLEEVKKLQPLQSLNALQTVGYTELFSYLNDLCTLEEAVQLIKRNTRHYAKRQLTWFTRDEQFHWFAPMAAPVIDFVTSNLHHPA